MCHGVDTAKITASYTDGVLTIRQPKQGPKEPENHTITIE